MNIERQSKLARLQRIDKLGKWLDARYRIPGTRIRFGYDGLLGLVPGIGDTLTLLLSAYIVREGFALKLPLSAKAKMLWNIFVDWLVGLIPIVGDLLDVGYKGNLKNIRLIKEHYRRRDPGPEIIEVEPRIAS